MEEKNTLVEGDFAPDFTFNDSNNHSLKLSNFLGKNVILYFYPRNFTPGCTTEASEFVEDYAKYVENDIIIIGVSPDNEKSHSEFRQHMKIPFFLASDSDKHISQKYGVFGLKKFMGKEYLGISRTTFLIDKNGKIVKIFNKVKPKGHSIEILSYLSNKNSNKFFS
jgi:peroxiredoxin Q/BCP